MSAPRVERDGKVAVLISPGYGAGWSTWADDQEGALFAPEVAAWVEAGKPKDADLLESFTDRYGYGGGLASLEIEWVPKGSRFIIDEYDGHESLTLLSPDYGWIA